MNAKWLKKKIYARSVEILFAAMDKFVSAVSAKDQGQGKPANPLGCLGVDRSFRGATTPHLLRAIQKGEMVWNS